MSIEQDGKEGELAFGKWLNRESVPYIHINQSPDFFSHAFTSEVKRPDFMVLLPQTGFIAVDVKHYNKGNNNFTLNITKELSKAIEFERLTRLYLWYAYKAKNEPEVDCWYFISAYEALEKGTKLSNSQTDEIFLSINLRHFEKLTTAEDFQKLFKARLGAVGVISRAIETYFRKID